MTNTSLRDSGGKLTLKDKMAYALEDSGLYPYPEFVNMFVSLFENRATKEQCDEMEKLISGGMNRKQLAKHFDKLYLEKSS